MEAGHLKPARSRGGLVVAWASALVVVACFVVAMMPRLPRDEIVRATTWSLAALASFVGFGGVVLRVCWPHERSSLALRGVVGASVLCAIGGVLASASLVSRAFFLAYVAAGSLLLVREIVARRDDIARAVTLRLRAARLQPAVAAVGLAVVAGVAVQFLGGASDVSSNPYDDDISYYPFAKQLLQRGTLLDPFSFRRMSTLGGQALHQALLLVRLPVLHLNVFDRSMCFVLAAGLLASHRVGSRRVPVLARFFSVLFLVGLPNLSINSASHYSGLAFFLALFQMLASLPSTLETSWRAAARRVLPVALVGAALCTLRQNYQPTVAFILCFSYASVIVAQRKRRRIRELLIEPVACLALVAILVVPWLVLLYRSNDTFLFPLMRGTFRAGVAVTSSQMTVAKYIRFFVGCWFDSEPIATLPLLAFVGLMMHDDNPRRPLASAWLATIVSFAMLCYAFSLSDSGNLARYVYGYGTAAALITWQCAATRITLSARRARAMLPAALALFALVLPLQNEGHRARKMLDGRLRDIDEMLRRTVAPQAEPPVARAYHDLQNAVPAGQPILVMLDQPYLLDFARNPILNLDMPGTASPKPDIPCFRGPEPVADYLRAQGIRYVMFVSPEKSIFLYRRDIWEDHLFDADEIWRVYAPYMVDVMDNLVALAQTRGHLAEEDNMTMLDLDAKR